MAAQYLSHEGTLEYFCTHCGRVRLNLRDELPTHCGNCKSENIVVDAIGSEKIDALRSQFFRTNTQGRCQYCGKAVTWDLDKQHISHENPLCAFFLRFCEEKKGFVIDDNYQMEVPIEINSKGGQG